MRLPSQDSTTGRSIKTGVQTFLGVVIVFITGLIGVIKGVPGCGEAVVNFLQSNAIQFAGLFGVSSGVVTFVWNWFRKDLKNY